MNPPLQIGIVGLGYPGRMHALALQSTPDAELRAIADLSPERRAAFIEEFGKPPVVYESFEDLLGDSTLDAIVISLPNFLHHPASLAVLQSGRHVLCEKPPTMNAGEMLELEAEADARKLVYFFGRQSRFSPEIIAGCEIVRSGQLGPIHRAEARWLRSRCIPVGIDAWFTDKRRSGGGVLIDLGVHALDAAWFLMNHPRPVTVSAKVSQSFAHLVPDVAVNNVEDCASAFVRFEDGSLIDLFVTWAGHHAEDPISATTEERNGYLNTTLHGQKGTLLLHPPTLITGDATTTTSQPIAVEANQSFDLQMQDFLDAILERKPPTNSARQAVHLMEMLDAIYQSSEAGCEIRLPGA